MSPELREVWVQRYGEAILELRGLQERHIQAAQVLAEHLPRRQEARRRPHENIKYAVGGGGGGTGGQSVSLSVSRFSISNPPWCVVCEDYDNCFSYEEMNKQIEVLEQSKITSDKTSYLRAQNEAKNNRPLAALDSMHKYFDKQLELLFFTDKQV